MPKYRRRQTRLECLRAELPRARRFTDHQSRLAFLRRARRGWVPNLPPEGPPFEMTVWVHQDEPLADLLKIARNGRRELSRATVEQHLGRSVATAAGLIALGRAGLAVVALSSTTVLLQSIDARAAEIVNRTRIGVARSGFRAARLIEAFLPVRDPDRSRVHVTDERRLRVALILENDFNIDGIELLNGTDRVHLRSSWTI